ncbi:unnamed protein product, partial [Nesidiocoris tenuis]
MSKTHYANFKPRFKSNASSTGINKKYLQCETNVLRARTRPSETRPSIKGDHVHR